MGHHWQDMRRAQLVDRGHERSGSQEVEFVGDDAPVGIAGMGFALHGRGHKLGDQHVAQQHPLAIRHLVH